MADDREYINLTAPQIMGIAEDNWNCLSTLQQLLHELKFRNSNAGVTTRNHVTERVKELSNENFTWPSTDAPINKHGSLGDLYWYKEGLLSYVGYQVGKTNGVSTRLRHKTLDCVLFNKLPNVQSKEYMDEWGEPKSVTRLKKMAECLASFCRNAKRNNPHSYRHAIDDWQSDLTYLKETYFNSGFPWPKTDN